MNLLNFEKNASSNFDMMSVHPKCILVDDMAPRMRDDAIAATIKALKRFQLEEDVAKDIKTKMVIQ